tara:strand:+ start:1237 stop:2247 length:1011 start_codon:yes stop_codon:yes gene_type:complete
MNFNDKIIELLKKGESDGQIKENIYNQYAIVLTKKTLTEKRLMVERMIGKKLIFDLSIHVKIAPPYKVLEGFKHYFCEDFFDLEIQDAKISNLVKLVVRDNRLTEIEIDFIKQKIEELDLSRDLVERLNHYIFSNNPYLDNIYSLILSDGLIKKEEVLFLVEKTIESNYDENMVSNRFWQYAIYHYLKALIKNESFSKIVKIWYLAYELKLKEIYQKNSFFKSLNVFESNDMEKTISSALEKLEYKINQEGKKVFKSDEFSASSLYDIIDFKTNTLKIVKNEKDNIVTLNKNLADIKKIYLEKPLKAFIEYEEFMKKTNRGISMKKIRDGFEKLVE